MSYGCSHLGSAAATAILVLISGANLLIGTMLVYILLSCFHHTNAYERNVLHVLMKGGAGPSNEEGATAVEDSWETWSRMRTMCEHLAW